MADLIAMLAAKLSDAKSKGHEWVLLVKYTRGGNSPRTWDRCRIVSGRPSLMGRCVGPGAIVGSWLFDVRAVDLEKWLDEKGRAKASP